MIRKFFVYLLANLNNAEIIPWFPKIILIVLSIMFFPITSLAQEPTEEWVKEYDGGYHERARFSAVDSFGNVYAVGTSYMSNWDILTIKYDTNGNELWVKRYDSGDDIPHAMTIDNMGNVYITGENNYGYLTIKYDSNGNELWVRKCYPGSLFNVSLASAIAVDSQGHVYVTGIADRDSITIKYDTNGNELWVKRYDSGYHNASTALAVDAAGNVYVTGYSHTNNIYKREIITIKYDSNGDTQWIKRYDDGYQSQANAIVVDLSGNVYITGYSLGVVRPDQYDFITVKYDITGNELWRKRYDNIERDIAFNIAVDSSEHAYVIGTSRSSSGSYDFVTIKYDAAGNELWIKRYDNGGYAMYIEMDSSDNIYIGGGYWPKGYIIKYDPNGSELWVIKTSLQDMSIDLLGNIYAIDNPSTYPGNFITKKYRQLSTLIMPSLLTAIDTPCDNGGSVDLTWILSPDDGSEVTAYRVYRSTTSGGPYDLIGSVNAGTNNYADATATNGTTYYYVVRATDGTNESSNSNEASATSARNLPLPPSSVTASDTPYDLGGSISLSWAKSTDDGTGLNNVLSYNIYRYSSTNGNIVTLATTQAGTASYVDATTLDSDTYYYFLKASDKNCGIESSASSIVSGQSVNNLTSLPGFISTLPGIAPELVNSLTSKVENAIASFDRGNETAAINQLNALLSEIAAQTGNKIEVGTAEILTNYVQNLINYIKSN